MKKSIRLFLVLILLCSGPLGLRAEEAGPIVEKAIAAAGGREKLLTLFRIEERYNFGAEPVAAEKSTRRTSVIEPPKYWWVGGKDRTGEPAKFDVWGWTLGVLTDPKSAIEVIPGVAEPGGATVALRVSGTVAPAMDLHFDAATHRLVRMDWINDIYRFSDWREHDGVGYQARTVISKKATGKVWFYHEITAIERLASLPEGLKREGE